MAGVTASSASWSRTAWAAFVATATAAAAELAPLGYVTAYAPVSGLPAAAYIGSPEGEGSMMPDLLAADPAVIGGLRIDTSDRGRHAAIREAFYGDVDEATATAAITLLSSDAPTTVIELDTSHSSFLSQPAALAAAIAKAPPLAVAATAH